MRTEYRLYRWSEQPHTPSIEDPIGYDTIADAMAAAGHTGLTDWRLVDDRRILTEEALARHGSAGQRMISPVQVPESDTDRVILAADIALEYGSYDGAHHKIWTIDQILRVLLGDRYEQTIVEYQAGEDGPDTYEWDTGIAP